MAVEVDARGPELALPPGEYRLVALDALVGADEVSPGAEGVVYRARGLDEDPWEIEALLRVPAAWMIHDREGRRRGVAAEVRREGVDRWVGLVQAPTDDDDPRLVSAPAVRGGPIVRTPHGWAGEGWSLESHPAARVRLRPFTWLGEVWPGSRLMIYHRRSADEVRTWLLGQGPMPWEETAPGRFEDALEDARRARVEVADGSLEFLRGLHGSDAWIACEAGLLDALARGALGPFVWDVREEDWGSYQASGEDPASLGEFLRIDADEALAQARHAALVAPRVFDLHAAATPEALVRELAAALGAGPIDSPADFERWLAAQPVPSLPRTWQLHVHPELAETAMAWFFDLFFRAQPRLRCRWTQAGG